LLETTINNHENEIIKQIYKSSPDILGISCYIWNMSFVKLLIPTIKKILPQTTIILGGPEVSYHAEELFENLDIDIIMEGEGEETWREYLDYRFNQTGSIKNISGLIYKENNNIYKNMVRTPLDLNHLPFVYENLTELKHRIIYYEASRGCPFNCQYCLSSVEKGVRYVSLDRVKEHLQYFYDHHVKQVKFVDRTFNANKEYALSIWDYLMAHDNGHTNFHFEIAAELLDDEIIERISHARPGLFQFEIGVQSTNTEVLKSIKRKMTYEAISKAVLKIKSLGNIHQHLDLIAGLPLETYDSFKNSFNDVIALRPEQLQLGFLKVLRGSGLRKDAAIYGLVYKQDPPYEILYTNAINYEHMLRLHEIEEMLERYYNSGRFKTTLEYLLQAFESPFNFFEELSLYWEQQGYSEIQHNKLAYYLKLAEFCESKKYLNHELCRELIRFDYLKHDQLNEIPALLQTLDNTRYKEKDHELLKDNDYISKAAPSLLKLSSRQRYRMTQIEHFKYDVLQSYSLTRQQDINPLTEPCHILFDYSSNTVQCILLR
jgi:radical SAM superfamily enzyme YgiQ (UPF0313 family)